MISKSDCVPNRQESCDLKIDLLVDFRSLLRDATHWKRNQAIPLSQTKSSHIPYRRNIKAQDEGRYRYCSMTEGLESLRVKLRPDTVRCAVQTRLKSSSDNGAKQKRFQIQQSSQPEITPKQNTEADQPQLSTIASSKLKIQISPGSGNQNQHQSFSRQTVEPSIILAETEHQSILQHKSEFEKLQPAVTLKTRIIDNHFQGGHQTLPIKGQNEQDISIQCSEGDLISQMENREQTVQEIFGIVPNLQWSSPNIRFTNRPKLHQALKLKLVDPFQPQVPINQKWRQRIQTNDRLVLSKELHRSLIGLPMSPKQKLENFETILFSRRPKVSIRTDQ